MLEKLLGDSNVYPVLRTAGQGDPWSLCQGEKCIIGVKGTHVAGRWSWQCESQLSPCILNTLGQVFIQDPVSPSL